MLELNQKLFQQSVSFRVWSLMQQGFGKSFMLSSNKCLVFVLIVLKMPRDPGDLLVCHMLNSHNFSSGTLI